MECKSCGSVKFNHKHTLKKYLLERKLLKQIRLAEEDIDRLIDEYVNKTNNEY